MQRSYFTTHALMMIFILVGAVVTAYGIATLATISPNKPEPMALVNGIIYLSAGASTLTVGLLGRAILHIAQSTAQIADHFTSAATGEPTNPTSGFVTAPGRS